MKFGHPPDVPGASWEAAPLTNGDLHCRLHSYRRLNLNQICFRWDATLSLFGGRSQSKERRYWL